MQLSENETIQALSAKCALLAASLNQAEAGNRKSDVDTVNRVFGKAPADILGVIGTASDTLDWLEELFTITKQLAQEDKPANQRRIARLADIGRYLAFEFSNYVGCEREDMEGHAKDSGVIGGAA